MQRVVKFDRRAWSLLRKATKRSRDSAEFYTSLYIFLLKRAGHTSAEFKLFKDLGKKLNPRAFRMCAEFDNKIEKLHQRIVKRVDWTANLNWGPSTRPGIDPAEVLIEDDYYI
jgi:hypothetical protein